ncbi:MAG: arylesterase, partial [Nitrospinota bacterium]
GLPHRVVNAGVSGDTTAGGLRRIHGILKQKPDIVILALGSNDGLRGFPPAEIKKNLDAIIKICLERGTKVLLAGMRIPPNYGPKYTGEFKAIYHRLAKKYNLPFIPFLLDGVAGKRGLNQSDGIHPKAEGYAVVTELVWQALLSMLE